MNLTHIICKSLITVIGDRKDLDFVLSILLNPLPTKKGICFLSSRPVVLKLWPAG